MWEADGGGKKEVKVDVEEAVGGEEEKRDDR